MGEDVHVDVLIDVLMANGMNQSSFLSSLVSSGPSSVRCSSRRGAGSRTTIFFLINRSETTKTSGNVMEIKNKNK